MARAKWMCEACGAALPGRFEPDTSRHARLVNHDIKPVVWVACDYGKPIPTLALSGSRRTPHGCVTWLSVVMLVVGLILKGVWYEDAYCQRHPDAGPDMRVDRPCVEILAESSAWRAVMGEIGMWSLLGSVIGFLVAAGWFVRHHLTER